MLKRSNLAVLALALCALGTPVAAAGAPGPVVTPVGPVSAAALPAFTIQGPAGAPTLWAISGPVSADGFGPRVATGAPLPDGNYELAAWSLDERGRLSDPAVVSFSIDTAAPGPPGILVGPGPRTEDAKPDFHWTGEPGATFTWQITSGGVRVHGPHTTTKPRTEVRGLPSGMYRFEVFQTDAAGNASPVATSAEFWLVRAPTIREGRKLSQGVKLLVQPVGLIRPVAGAQLRHTRPLLRWRVRARRRPTLYNVQVFDGRRKVLSSFPVSNALRIPERVLRPGRRYYWQVWVYHAGRGYERSPLAIGYFDAPRRGARLARSRERLPARTAALAGAPRWLARPDTRFGPVGAPRPPRLHKLRPTGDPHGTTRRHRDNRRGGPGRRGS